MDRIAFVGVVLTIPLIVVVLTAWTVWDRLFGSYRSVSDGRIVGFFPRKLQKVLA